MISNEGLSGTQSRTIPALPSLPSEAPRIRKIKRVDEGLLNADVNVLRIGDVGVLQSELKRLVAALEEFGGFED